MLLDVKCSAIALGSGQALKPKAAAGSRRNRMGTVLPTTRIFAMSSPRAIGSNGTP